MHERCEQAHEIVDRDPERGRTSVTLRHRISLFWEKWLRPTLVSMTWRLLQWDDPARGDIVVLLSPVDGRRFLKRVIGLPGDCVAVRRGQTFIDGESVSYLPMEREQRKELERLGFAASGLAVDSLAGLAHVALVGSTSLAGHDFGPVVVPAGHYFLVGDDNDSGSWGFASRDNILGRAAALTLSVDLDRYRPRWSRFFTALP